MYYLSGTLPVGYYWISWKPLDKLPTSFGYPEPYQLVITGLVGNINNTVWLPLGSQALPVGYYWISWKPNRWDTEIALTADPTSWLLLD